MVRRVFLWINDCCHGTWWQILVEFRINPHILSFLDKILQILRRLSSSIRQSGCWVLICLIVSYVLIWNPHDLVCCYAPLYLNLWPYNLLWRIKILLAKPWWLYRLWTPNRELTTWICTRSCKTFRYYSCNQFLLLCFYKLWDIPLILKWSPWLLIQTSFTCKIQVVLLLL